MRRLHVVIMCVGALTVVAQAQPVIEFYYSKMSCESAEPYSYSPPPEYGDGAMFTTDPGETVYLWCRTPLELHWSFAIDFTGDVASGWMHDEVPCISSTKCTRDRWENGSDFDPTDDGINLIEVTTWGIGSTWDDAYSIPEPGWTVVHFCIGSIGWGTPGYKFMSVGSGLMVRTGHITSDVYFSFNPDGTPEYAGSGVEVGTTSDRAEIFIKSEPVGDMNCDGLVNALDINPFRMALIDPAVYYANHPDCNLEAADCNYDGSLNSLDIDPFVAILTG